MKNDPKHSVTEELLYRYFHQETSSEETLLVESWKNISVENGAEFDRIQLLYLDTLAIQNMDKPAERYDTTSAWKKFRKENVVAKSLDIHIPYSVLRIAAAVVIMLGGAWWFFSVSNSSGIITQVASSQMSSFELQDGSDITLNKNSELIYQEAFSHDKREVTLRGEAFFEIERDAKRPFIIRVGKTEIQVLGTSFNINAVNEDSIVVSVKTGKVWFKSLTDAQVLTAGQKAVYLSSSERLTAKNSTPTGVEDFWKTRTLNFASTSLRSVVQTLESTYHTSILLSDRQIGNCRISVRFENESIENILDVIGATLELKVESNGNQFTLHGEGCQ